MTHTEIRRFLKAANIEKLSPAEKDVFQYYYSRAFARGGWHCPDAETAEEVYLSRPTVNQARNALRGRKWIDFDEKAKDVRKKGYFVRILKTFDEKPTVENPTVETPTVEDSTLTVENSTETVEFSTLTTVENSTLPPDPLIRNTREDLEENQEKENTQEKGAARAEIVSIRSVRTCESRGTPVDEVLGALPATIEEFKARAFPLIAGVYGLKYLPRGDDREWEHCRKFAFDHDFSPDELLETLRILRRQTWGCTSRVTPKLVEQNLPDLVNLRAGESREKIKQENDYERTPGTTKSVDFSRFDKPRFAAVGGGTTDDEESRPH